MFNSVPLTKDLLSVYDVAAAVDRSPSTVYAWSKAGILPAPITLAGRARWRRSDLEQWAAAGFPENFQPETERGNRRVEA